jgi:amino-acid N-acetyltransferase
VEQQPIEAADTAEVSEIRDELRQIGRMMWEDLEPQHSQFWVCRHNGKRIAWVGLEIDGASALLRSLYTDPEQRKLGIGRRLVERAEREAAARGVGQIYLFSTGAGGFFQSLGYVEVAVSDTVDALRNAPQVRWYLARPELLASEVTFAKVMAPNKPAGAERRRGSAPALGRPEK